MREILAATNRRVDADAAEEFQFAGARCFFVGAGGCGMSGLAREFVARGAHVSGVDQTLTQTTEALSIEGVDVTLDDANAVIPGECDCVVLSAAIKDDHPLARSAQERGLKTMTYAQALGRCMLGRTGVAIAGTHGKSTTTAMLGVALAKAGLDPSVIVGAEVPQLAVNPKGAGVGHRVGSETIPAGDLTGQPGVFLTEACEFNRSFHQLRPLIASIGTVEADHLDVYGSLEAMIEAYAQFAKNIASVNAGGLLLIGHEGAHRREIASGLQCRTRTIGFSPDADWRIETGKKHSVSLTIQGRRLIEWTRPMPGVHNVFNSAVAGALAIELGANPHPVGLALSSFAGLRRRMEFLGDRPLPLGGTVRVYDDYGHHPTEVDATLRAIRSHEKMDEKGGRLICVFQPHQHSRTRFLLDEFAQSFSQADLVIVPDIYFVRDSEIEKTKVSAGDLVDRLRRRDVQAMHVYPFEAIVEQLSIVCQPSDVLVVMGAGPVWKVARSFMGAAAQKAPA